MLLAWWAPLGVGSCHDDGGVEKETSGEKFHKTWVIQYHETTLLLHAEVDGRSLQVVSAEDKPSHPEIIDEALGDADATGEVGPVEVAEEIADDVTIGPC